MPTEEQTYREFVKEKLETIDLKVSYTNGKVKKLIIALAILGGILIGQNVTNTHDLITLFAGIVR